MRKEIMLAGFGGQGIILMGVVMAQMMEKYPDLQVAQAQSYGPVSRGGACRTDVVISDREIHFPKSICPDVMVFMSEEAVKRYIQEVDPEKTLVVYDSTLIRSIPAPFKKTFPVPATQVAEGELKNRIVANMFMLGAIIEQVTPGSFPYLQEVVKRSVPAKSQELNMKALQGGYDFAKANARN
ncbi:MAG TPA: 2-oxoacid:acceptor oxidoreductase family protein [Thermodesulfobacteriota bacterium]|nr:2-oxoacid:acceptor oxidoreductase family protein [Thermodesulfobacteriota bacterium]